MKDIRDITADELKDFVLHAGEKAFRAKQINEWLWKKGVGSFDEMTNIGKAMQDKLKETFSFQRARVEVEAKSSDQTVKFGFRLHDDKMIEGVLIPAGQRKRHAVTLAGSHTL